MGLGVLLRKDARAGSSVVSDKYDKTSFWVQYSLMIQSCVCRTSGTLFNSREDISVLVIHIIIDG